MPAMPTRLAMKLGVSLARTTPLPRVVTKEAFELVEDLGPWPAWGSAPPAHVARRVEEVDAAEARLELARAALRQLGDRQARGVAGHDGMRRDAGAIFLYRSSFQSMRSAMASMIRSQPEQVEVLFVVGGWISTASSATPSGAGLSFFRLSMAG
jgi:hypothetical protein